MKKNEEPLKCYIAAFQNAKIDPVLENSGFSRSLLIFSIPTYGILFRIRAEGELIDLEFAAMFALLKFVKNKLRNQEITSLQIISSNPQFVFAFTGNTSHLKKGTERYRMLSEYQKEFQLQIAFIESIKNKAMALTSEYPGLPEGAKIELVSEPSENKIEFKPFQRGIRI